MSDIVRVTPHPDDPNIVVLHVPRGCNTLMGRYEPAQLDKGHGYLLMVELLDSFEAFARYNGWYLLDERGKSAGQVARQHLCDICAKPERLCQTSAGNIGALRDHAFTPIPQADAQRHQATRSRP